MWIGIDDTDSSTGMCTTYLAMVIAGTMDLDLIKFPRLVRLNPNIPWKTRGNAAISLNVGIGKGKKIKIGEFNSNVIYSYEYGDDSSLDERDILEKLKKIVEKYAVMDEEKTSPGIVVTRKKISEKLYWKAVRSVIDLNEIFSYLENASYFGYKYKRGLIGASSAISWKPKRKTYELLTYLPEDKWNGERFIDKKSVILMDKKIKTTFENFDYNNDHIAIKPETKTPVLFGIRGTNVNDLEMARKIVKSDPYFSYLIFETNQGTDDHLVKKKISEIKPYDSVILDCEVLEKPKTIPGGHVIFKVKDRTGEIFAAAYEKTKEFREIIKNLDVGDEIKIFGSVKKYPKTLNIEKILIKNLAEIKIKVIPICPKCGKKMESAGKNKGYRCRNCGTFTNEIKYEKIERNINPGLYQVPVIARRHLSKPVEFFR
ncbi:MAG: TiaS agmantine-binding domain-containing protein [Thermoplasmata archaeon]|nr:tRNA(Ile)(2)-agmatinylcytidine synthase [Thermoplasmata archaeon]